ncbi:hypothetical protein HJC23_013615 [Cyclotella cryptica]|uniref:Uncharacterized protein n=1 Tax=Cyclotella cryptica TaxID=29204 RepID=A0ABD3PPQ3_9STRA
MTRLVFWYGVKFEDRGQAYSFVPSSKIITYEEGEQGGYCNMPKKIQSKIDKRIKLTKTEEQIMRGLKEIKADMAKDKSERIQWMMHFQEDYELAESMLDPEPELEPMKPMATQDADLASGEIKIKRKPGRPKKSETFDDEGKSKKDSADLTAPIKRKPGRPKKSESSVATADGLDAPIKRKPGRPKKTDSEKSKPKEKSKPVEKSKLISEPEHKPKKFVIVDEDNDFALESDDDEQDKDYNEDSSDEISLKDSDDADDEQSDKESRKRKALDQLKKLKKKSKASLTEEDEDEERRRKAAEYREKKLKEKADALGLDYVPRRKKPKTNVYEEEQNRFSECEDVFLPLIDQLQGAKDGHIVKAVLETIEKLIENVEILTPPFLRSYPLGMLVRDVRKSFESSDPEVKEHCKRLTNEMKRVYSQKEKSTPDDFVPKKRAERRASSEVSEGSKKVESENHVVDVEAVKTEDTTEQATIQNNADTTTNHDQTLRPAESDLVKPEPAKPLKKTFSIKGMFEKPKPTPKPKIIPAAIVSGPVSPKPKSLPSWVTGPAVKMEDFHEHHAKERNFALEFLTDAASTIPSNKVDPMSISQSLELAIFAETKLRGRDWNRYWEKVHDVVAMISPGTNQPNSIALGIARGDYQDPSQLVTLSRREIHSLNQQRLKSLI